MTLPNDPIKREEYLKKLRVQNKGRVRSEELKKRISLSLKGRKCPPRSQEWSLKISLAKKGKPGSFTGKKHRADSIELIRRSRIGKPMKFSAQGLENKRLSCKNRIWSPESLKKISLSKLGKPRPEHVRQALIKASTGRIISDETRRKMSIANMGRKWSEESKQKLRDKRKNWKIPYTDSKPERMMQIALALNGIKYEKQKLFKLGTRWHQVDIFIEPNIVVEVDGIKWHIPIDRIKRDLFQTQELTIMGYHVIRIRDKDILKNTQGCAEKVIQLIKELQHRYLPIG